MRNPRSRTTRRAPKASLMVIAAVVVALHGCSTTPVTTSAPPAPGAAAEAPAQPLAVERDWLQSWFGGTPVVIAQREDGAVGVEVPREFCFDPGRSTVKPPLAAVLDKLAQSLRRTGAHLPLVAAPGDAATASPLALQRATQLRKHLLARGVSAAKIGTPTATAVAAVQLRMELAPH